MTTASYIAQIQNLDQRIADNFDYVSSKSVAKAERLLEAVQAKIALYPEDSRNGAGESIRFNMLSLLEMKRDVQKWIATQRNVASSQIVYGEYCDE